MNQEIDLSIIITTYKTKDLLKTCLQSLFQDLKGLSITTEVLVIDNASHDGTVEMVREDYPSVMLIENQENVGLARALNQGIEIARGRYLLTMDSDVEILEDCIGTMVNYLEENPAVSGVVTDEFNEKGERKRTRTKVGVELKLIKPDFSRPFSLEFTGNTFSMIRKTVYEDVGLYDLLYKYSVEDLDWAHRAKNRGHRFVLLPDCHIIHYGRRGKKKNYSLMVEELYRSNMHYYGKFYHPLIVSLLYWGMRLEIRLKLCISHRGKEWRETYLRAREKMEEEYHLIGERRKE